MQQTYSPLYAAIQKTKTKNDCLTYETTSDPCVDLFFSINAARNMEEDILFDLFSKAFKANPEDACKILFYSRDIRGGQGERNTFRNLLKRIANDAEMANPFSYLVPLIPHYGRWDDMFTLFDTPLEPEALVWIEIALKSTGSQTNALCAKWMPREKSSKKHIAKKIMKKMNLTPRSYRKLLSQHTSVVENLMCQKDWDNISFEKVPSLAMRNYRKAFKRNTAKWEDYIKQLESGEATVNANALYPHDIVNKYFPNLGSGALCSFEQSPILEQQWKALPNYMQEDNMVLPLVDVSGSMYSGNSKADKMAPIFPAISLGLYIAEKNKGPFKDHFITFSEMPKLEKIEGDSLAEKVGNLKNADWGYNTNISAVFDTLLEASIENEVDPNDMPNQILILSDMEFDTACANGDSVTAYEYASHKYNQAGYTLPKIVFWNLNSSGKNCPVEFNQMDTALVSGFSPVILKQILSTEKLTPETIMRNVLDGKRYSQIKFT
tara:strand:- start:231 stop:1709 length:1479 start_codon:yes stop_codon:yes gene_type:complete